MLDTNSNGPLRADQGRSPSFYTDVRARISAAHRTVAREIGIALLYGDRGSWSTIGRVLRGHLTADERVALAVATWLSLEPADLEAVLGQVAPEHVGAPLPSLSGEAMADARWWASRASDVERHAYAVACLAHMPPAERQEIVALLHGRVAA